VLLTLPIREVLPATPRARLLRLDLGGHSFPYLAGQALLIASRGYVPRRPYSIASAPEDAARDGYLELLIGVDAEGAPGPHLTFDAGARLDVDGPVGRFTLPEQTEEKRFLFIAGGTGIAPLRAMLRHALHRPHREIGLFYSARAAGEFAFEEELRRLAREGRIELRQAVTREEPDGTWDGMRGRIRHEDLAPFVHDPATLCFICGPPALVEEMPAVLQSLGVEKGRIRVEEWG